MRSEVSRIDRCEPVSNSQKSRPSSRNKPARVTKNRRPRERFIRNGMRGIILGMSGVSSRFRCDQRRLDFEADVRDDLNLPPRAPREDESTEMRSELDKDLTERV